MTPVKPMPAGGEVLVLHHARIRPCSHTMYCSDTELHLSEDGHHVLLSRYAELYSHGQVRWRRVCQHRVPLVRLLRWMLENGEPVSDR